MAWQGREAHQRRRLSALVAVAEGRSRGEAAEIGGMSRQALRDAYLGDSRGSRFQGQSLRGTARSRKECPSRNLASARKSKPAAPVDACPNRKTGGVVRRRRLNLKAMIEDRVGMAQHGRALPHLLHELGVPHLRTRVRHPDRKAQGAG